MIDYNFHSIEIMDEPFYQCTAITQGEVYNDLFCTLKYKCPNKYILSYCINKTIDKVNYGSYRGYYTFLHNHFKKEVEELYNSKNPLK